MGRSKVKRAVGISRFIKDILREFVSIDGYRKMEKMLEMVQVNLRSGQKLKAKLMKLTRSAWITNAVINAVQKELWSILWNTWHMDCSMQ